MVQLELTKQQVALLKDQIVNYTEEINSLTDTDLHPETIDLFKKITEDWVSDCADNSCMIYLVRDLSVSHTRSSNCTFTYYDNVLTVIENYGLNPRTVNNVDVVCPMMNEGMINTKCIYDLVFALIRKFGFNA